MGQSENKLGEWLGYSFILDYDYAPSEFSEEIRSLWCKVIEQAIFEFTLFKYSRIPAERALYYSARDFLFDDSYTIFFGERDITFKELLDMLGLDAEWIRRGILQKDKLLNEGKGYLVGTQLPLF